MQVLSASDVLCVQCLQVLYNTFLKLVLQIEIIMMAVCRVVLLTPSTLHIIVFVNCHLFPHTCYV